MARLAAVVGISILAMGAGAESPVALTVEPTSALSLGEVGEPTLDSTSLAGYVYALDAPPIVQFTPAAEDNITVAVPLRFTHFRMEVFAGRDWELTFDTTFTFSAPGLLTAAAPVDGGLGEVTDLHFAGTHATVITGVCIGPTAFDCFGTPDFVATASAPFDLHYRSQLLYELDGLARRITMPSVNVDYDLDMFPLELTYDSVWAELLWEPWLSEVIAPDVYILHLAWAAEVNATFTPAPIVPLLSISGRVAVALALTLVGVRASRAHRARLSQ